MRVRKLDANGDVVFGRGRADFLADSPEMVAQMARTRLLLSTGEWFLDVAEGTPYGTEILGAGTAGKYDPAIQLRLLKTPGVLSILEYGSHMDAARKLTVTARLDTIFGATQTITQAIP
jgi:hypothetical protein